MSGLLRFVAASALGYFAARFAGNLFGLDQLAEDLAAWWRNHLPSVTYGSPA